MMHCSKNRKRLQEWFDQPVSPLPPDVAEHVKSCPDCRTLVTRWNAIELEIQAMKTQGPELPVNFAAMVRDRMRQPDLRRPWNWPAMAWRVATVSAVAVVAAMALFFVLGGAKYLNFGPKSGTEAQIPTPVHSSNIPSVNLNK